MHLYLIIALAGAFFAQNTSAEEQVILLSNDDIEVIRNQQCAGEFILKYDDQLVGNKLIYDTNIEDIVVNATRVKDELLITTKYEKDFFSSAYLRITLSVSSKTVKDYFQSTSTNSYLDGSAFQSTMGAKITGSGDLLITGLSDRVMEELTLTSTGSGNVAVNGLSGATEVKAKSTGSGEISLLQVVTDSTTKLGEVTLESTGSGDVCVSGTGVTGDSLTVSTSGSGDVSLKSDGGEFTTLDLTSSGSGKINTCNVNGGTVSATTLGSGDIRLRCDNGEVTGIISGSGDVYHKTGSDATVDLSETGSGAASKISECPNVASCATVKSLPSSPETFGTLGIQRCSSATRASATFALVVVFSVVFAVM